MDLAAKLLLGSSRVDQWRKEITTVMNMVLGFLTTDDYATLNLKDETLLAEAGNHRWMIWNDPIEGLRFRLYHLQEKEAAVLACEFPGNRISLEYVGFVHAYLDSFVRGMQKLFPVLRERWNHILRVARDEFCIYYEIHFHIPSDAPSDGEEGKFYNFQKKSLLSFPLPLDTEVFVQLEGEPSEYKELVLGGVNLGKRPVDDDGDCFFRVVGYSHEMQDSYGDLSEQKFIMILSPDDEWKAVPAKDHFPHLLEVNGWEQVS